MFVRVTLFDLEGVSHQVELPATEPIYRLMPALLQRLRLPSAAEGIPLQYDLCHYESGDLLKPVCTLHMAGVVNGSSLRLRATFDPHAPAGKEDPFSTATSSKAEEADENWQVETSPDWRSYLPQLAIGAVAIAAMFWLGLSYLAGPVTEFRIVDPGPDPIVVTRIVPIVVEPVEVRRSEPIVISQPVLIGPEFQQLVASPAGLCFIVDNVTSDRQVMCHEAESGRLEFVMNASGQGEGLELVQAANQFYFVNQQTSFLSNIWQSDGTAMGTQEILSIPGLAASPPLLIGTSYLFAQPEQLNGWQSLHLFDRGSSSAQRFANLYVSHDWYKESLLHNGVLYFAGRTEDSGWELWRTDGSIAGTYLLQDISAGAAGSSPRDMVPAAELIYFTADSGSGRQIWVSNGRPAGAQPYALNSGSDIINPRQLTLVGDTLFFVADTEIGERVIWSVQDGQSLPLLALTGRSFEIAASETFLYLADIQSSGSVDVWQFEAAGAEPSRLGSFPADAYRPVSLAVIADEAYMILGQERALWRAVSEGYELEPVADAPFGVNQLTASHDALYFTVEADRGGESLYFLAFDEITAIDLD